MGNVKSFDSALELYKNGKIRPIVNKCFNMSEIHKAHEYLENGNQIGKVIIIPS